MNQTNLVLSVVVLSVIFLLFREMDIETVNELKLYNQFSDDAHKNICIFWDKPLSEGKTEYFDEKTTTFFSSLLNTLFQ